MVCLWSAKKESASVHSPQTGNRNDPRPLVTDRLHSRVYECTQQKQAANVRFGSKADIGGALRGIRFAPKADISRAHRDVRFVQKADSCTAARSMSVMRTRTVAARMAATITNLLWNKGCDGSASRANKNRLYVRTDVRRLRRTTRFERNDPNDAQTRSCPRKQERALHHTADTY